jgi:pyruvate ferredoxin oxidoreductase alpha subunit
MPEIFNSYQAVVNGARLCRAQVVIDSGTEKDISNFMSKFPDWQPEYFKMSGVSGTCAAIGRAFQSKRVFLSDAALLKSLALHRLPVMAVSEKPRNWALNWWPSTSQEALEMTIASYVISEDRSVLLPSCIVLDKMSIETYENVVVPGQKTVDNMLKPLKLEAPEKHIRYYGDSLVYVAKIHKAMENVHKMIPKFSDAWKKRFGKAFSFIETFMMEDAECAVVVVGSMFANAKSAVQNLRSKGEKVGVVRIRSIKPWPEQELRAALSKAQKIAVVDSLVFPGSWSKMYQMIKLSHVGLTLNFIVGNEVSVKDFVDVFERTKKAEKAEMLWVV